jgi:hypothetical protein
MYYYYYYFEPETGKVTINLSFKEKNKEPVSLEQLMDFFNSINELHKSIVFLTQPEYTGNSNNLDKIDEVSLLSYHQLEIEKINRENPFFLTLSFRLVAGGAVSYWALWKIFISICNRYGKNTTHLSNTIEDIFKELENISSKIKQLRFQSKLNEILVDDEEKDEYKELIQYTKELIINALKNPKFSKIYNSLCLGSIVITDAFSTFDPENLADLADLAQSIIKEKITFLDGFIEN